jgi:hypothetical protein
MTAEITDDELLEQLNKIDASDAKIFIASLRKVVRGVNNETDTKIWISFLNRITNLQESFSDSEVIILAKPLCFTDEEERKKYMSGRNMSEDEIVDCKQTCEIVTTWNKATLKGKYAGKVALSCARDNLVASRSKALKLAKAEKYDNPKEREAAIDEVIKGYDYNRDWHCVVLLYLPKNTVSLLSVV